MKRSQFRGINPPSKKKTPLRTFKGLSITCIPIPSEAKPAINLRKKVLMPFLARMSNHSWYYYYDNARNQVRDVIVNFEKINDDPKIFKIRVGNLDSREVESLRPRVEKWTHNLINNVHWIAETITSEPLPMASSKTNNESCYSIEITIRPKNSRFHKNRWLL